MPWMIVKDGNRFCVHKELSDKTPGDEVACHETEEQAQAQMRALYANEPEAGKIGARHSARDQTTLQAIHDYSVEAGAVCAGEEPGPETEPEAAPPPAAATTPADRKATIKSMDADTAIVAGYGVIFGGRDLQGDTFTPETDLSLDMVPVKSVFYDHTLGDVPEALGKVLSVTKDKLGAWVEAQLDRHRAYVEDVLKLIEAGALGYSSGSVSHLVRRDGGKLVKWPVVEWSLTPTPAEIRTVGVSRLKALAESNPGLKALLPEAPGEGAGQDASPGAVTQESSGHEEGTNMPEFNIDELAAKVAEQLMEKAPALKTGFAGPQVTADEGDKPFASMGEQMQAVKTFYLSGGMSLDPKLAKFNIKATGLSESVGSEGGFLVQPQFTDALLVPLHTTGVFSSKVRRLPVGSGNNGTINGVAETSRADGSRWGGIRGYRLAEGGTKTASKPAFTQLSWKLKKYAVLCYATDELLEDTAQLESVIRQGAGEEIDFMANDDILNGGGAGGPLGVLASPSLVSVTKETNQAADTIVYPNITKMWARVATRSKSTAIWCYNADCRGVLDQLIQEAGLGAIPARFITYAPDGQMMIYGRPALETEFNATLGDKGDIVVFDPSQYLFWEKGGVQAASSIHVQFLTDESVFRFVYRCDGMPAWSSALTPYKGTATVSPFVTLDARA